MAKAARRSVKSDKPDFIIVSRAFNEAMREAECKLGPRHRLVDRWRHELGWNVEPSAVATWLEPERRNGR